ncbi:MAG: 6-phospho-beta-glucosidase, partial [Theionarchaea archaeon]|nr:6-phospho-beta-glucosidase [Theionarchaea archaeon]
YRIAQQELAVHAALEGDKRLALQAMVLDPLVGSMEDADGMLGDLLDASSRYLPQFG